MGLQQKLEKAYQKGFNDGQGVVNDEVIEAAELRGVIKGASETWEIIENMIPKLDGVGPKTKEKILLAIQNHAKQEKEKFVKNQRPFYKQNG